MIRQWLDSLDLDLDLSQSVQQQRQTHAQRRSASLSLLGVSAIHSDLLSDFHSDNDNDQDIESTDAQLNALLHHMRGDNDDIRTEQHAQQQPQDNSNTCSSPSDSLTLSLPDSFGASYLFEAVAQRVQGGAARIINKQTNCPRCLKVQQHYVSEKNAFVEKESSLKRELTEAFNRVTTLEMELSQSKRIAAISEDSAKRELQTLMERLDRLKTLYDAELAVRATIEEKSLRDRHRVLLLESCEDEAKRLRLQVAELQDTHRQQLLTIERLSETERDTRRNCGDNEKVKELIKLDKEHLQNEVHRLQRLLGDAEKRGDDERSRAVSAEINLTNATSQMLDMQSRLNQEFEERRSREISQLQRDCDRRVEEIKEIHRETSERLVGQLREENKSLESKLIGLDHRFQSLSHENSSLQQTILNITKEKNDEVSGLRSELLTKSAELSNLGARFEERMGQLRHTELSLERAQKEIHVHRSALLHMEGEHNGKVKELQIALDQATLRVQSYEALEVEIDEAVMRTAQDATTAESSSSLMPGIYRGLIPSDPQRRVRQAVFLAQKLLSAESRIHSLEEQLQKSNEHLNSCEANRDQLKAQLARCSQPAIYLTEKLQQEESRRVHSELCREQLRNENEKSIQLHQQMKKENEGLRDRMKLLLEQRGELQVVKKLLEHIEDMEECSSSDDESDEGVKESKTHTPPRVTAGDVRPKSVDNKSVVSVGSLSSASTGSSPQRRRELDPLQKLANRLKISQDTLRTMTTPPSAKGNGASAKQNLHEESYTVTPFGPGAVHGIRQITFASETNES